MPHLPKAIESEIVARLYADAERLDWLHLSLAERRRQYSAWLKSPDIGGVLSRFLPPEVARVWIKDGPMKEFARAIAGAGPFSKFVAICGRSPSEMVRLIMGEGWSLVDKSAGIKPLHCIAEHRATLRYLCWGPPKDYKHLLWAALCASEAGRLTARVVIVEAVGQDLPEDQRGRFARLAARCGLEFGSVRLG